MPLGCDLGKRANEKPQVRGKPSLLYHESETVWRGLWESPLDVVAVMAFCANAYLEGALEGQRHVGPLPQTMLISEFPPIETGSSSF
jgi:hypothetical protein